MSEIKSRVASAERALGDRLGCQGCSVDTIVVVGPGQDASQRLAEVKPCSVCGNTDFRVIVVHSVLPGSPGSAARPVAEPTVLPTEPMVPQGDPPGPWIF